MGTISLQIPQTGQFDSTEDPKIAANFIALSTLLNGGLDQTNLSPSAVLPAANLGIWRIRPISAASVSATNGDYIFAFGAIAQTVTLPVPSAGAMVGVFTANKTAPTTMTVTVATPSGTIYGRGLAEGSATSFPLGASQAGVILVGDGSRWNIIAGEQDTGWVPLTGNGSFQAVTDEGYRAGIRLRGDMVYLRGDFQNTGADTGFSANLYTTPVQFRPAQLISVPLFRGKNLSIYTGGLVDTDPTVVASEFVSIDGVSYSLI